MSESTTHRGERDTEEPNVVVQPGEVLLILARDGVTEVYQTWDHVREAWRPHQEHLSYEDLATEVKGALTLTAGYVTKTPNGNGIAGIGLRFRTQSTPVLSSVVPQPNSGGSKALLTGGAKSLPTWASRYLEYLNRPGTQPYLVAETIRSRGTVTRGELARELKSHGYTGRSGAIDRTIQFLRDYLGKVTQRGRGDRATYHWTDASSGSASASLTLSRPPNDSIGIAESPNERAESYLGKRILGFRLNGERYEVRTAKEMLLKLGSVVIPRDPAKARNLVGIRGTLRQYFSEQPNEISGVPARIPGTQLYVETNLSRNRVVWTCEQILRVFGIPPSAFEIFVFVEQGGGA